MRKFFNIPIEEKETLIHFDYFNKKMNIYTTRVASMRKLEKAIGIADKTEKTNGQIVSMEWNIPFEHRKNIKKALSLSIILPFKKLHKSY